MWVITFSDRVVKIFGYIGVMSHHISLPDLPPARYYSININLPISERGFLWVWSYINGLDTSSIHLRPADYSLACAYLSYFNGKTSLENELKRRVVTPIDYPIVKLTKEFLSFPQSDKGSTNIEGIITLLAKKKYMRHILDEEKMSRPFHISPEDPLRRMDDEEIKTGQGIYLTEKDRNYLSLSDSTPPSLVEDYVRVSGALSTLRDLYVLIPVIDSKPIFAKIDRYPISGHTTNADIIKLFKGDRKVLGASFSVEGKMMELYISERDPEMVYVDLNKSNPVSYYQRTMKKSKGLTLDPYPVISHHPPLATGIHFTVGDRKVVGYPAVCRSRSELMREALSRSALQGSKGEILSFLEGERFEGSIEYVWNFINGLDSYLTLEDLDVYEALSITRWMNYFAVEEETDLYEQYLIDLCNKVEESGDKRALQPFIVVMAGLRKRHIIFYRGLADRVIASLISKGIANERMFTYPFNKWILGPLTVASKIGAIYEAMDQYGNVLDVRYPLLVPDGGILLSDDVYSSARLSVEIEKITLIMTTHRGYTEEYTTLYGYEIYTGGQRRGVPLEVE